MILVKPWVFGLAELRNPERWVVDWSDEKGVRHRRVFDSQLSAMEFSVGELCARKLRKMATEMRPEERLQ
jgi:hypothetical protein